MRKYKTIEVKDYEQMLEEISTSKSIDLDNFDLLIYGAGGQNKKYYSDLKRNAKCEVLWTGWSGPKWTSILSFIPGQAGLIKIKEQEAFKEMYYELAAYSVSDAIYIPKSYTGPVLNEVRIKNWKAKFYKFIDIAPSSFVLTSEADEVIEEEGRDMYLYDYYIGSEVNPFLIEIIKRRKEKRKHNS